MRRRISKNSLPASSVLADLNKQDVSFMRVALSLAHRGLGSVWPNPAVGCVIVAERAGAPVVVGRGWTQPGGRPHAETVALSQAGNLAKGATAYVTLEPCCHHGKSPPCTEALIEAGITRVVAAMEDPDSRVSGKGNALLKEAGIDVKVGLCRGEAERVNEGFISRVNQNRPMITLKTATTLDSRIATVRGESHWITGPNARARVHLMRASHDAVLVGIGTALADNPSLTVRLPGLEAASPVRIVVDTRLQLPLTANLVTTVADVPTWLLTVKGGDVAKKQAYRDCGVEIITIPPDRAGYPDIHVAMQALASKGITRLLVEGGADIAATFLRTCLVDRIAWFRAPSIMGGDGISAVAAYGLAQLDDILRFDTVSSERLGNDWLETYSRSD